MVQAQDEQETAGRHNRLGGAGKWWTGGREVLVEGHDHVQAGGRVLSASLRARGIFITTTLSEQNYTLSRTTLSGAELHFEQNYTQNSNSNSRVQTYHNK